MNEQISEQCLVSLLVRGKSLIELDFGVKLKRFDHFCRLLHLDDTRLVHDGRAFKLVLVLSVHQVQLELGTQLDLLRLNHLLLADGEGLVGLLLDFLDSLVAMRLDEVDHRLQDLI